MRATQSGVRHLIFAITLPCIALLSSPSPSQGQPILHEPVSAPTLNCAGGVCQRVGEQSSALPDAVVGEDGLIGAPLGGRNPQQHEPVFSSANQSSPLADMMRGAPPPGHDPPPVRRARVAPDAETGLEPPGEHVYHEVFNPAVFPYKRMTTLDAVDESGTLYTYDPRPRPLPLSGNRLQPGRDPFYGSLVVDFIAGELVPLPTPAAPVRMLSYQTTPEMPLAFYSDAADNVYVQAARSGRHRLVFLVDAEQRYFAGQLVPSTFRRSLRLDGLPPVAPVPRGLKREAEKVMRHIGVRATPGTDYLELLNRLVAYFRAFQMGELPPELDEEGRRTSLYSRIALSQRGVCRHRSYAFLITALAAGIPVRYVENELHVFVEVYIPAVGDQTAYWRRINLGGAPLQQRVFGGENRESYQEKGSDPFERPPSFTRGAPAQVSGAPKKPASTQSGRKTNFDGGEGGKDASSESGSKSGNGKSGDGGGGPGDPSRSGTSPGGKSGDGSGTGSRGSGGNSSGSGSKGDGEGGESGESELPARSVSDSVVEPSDPRVSSAGNTLIPTQVTVAVGAARRIYRGALVPVRGTVHADRGSAANLEVLLLLAVSQHPLILGRTVTRTDGSFDTEVEIPGGAPVGHFQVVARVRGDDKRRGSTSGQYDRLPRSPTELQEFLGNR